MSLCGFKKRRYCLKTGVYNNCAIFHFENWNVFSKNKLFLTPKFNKWRKNLGKRGGEKNGY